MSVKRGWNNRIEKRRRLSSVVPSLGLSNPDFLPLYVLWRHVRSTPSRGHRSAITPYTLGRWRCNTTYRASIPYPGMDTLPLFFFFSFDPLKNLSTCFSDFISALSESGYIPRYPFERYATDIPKLYKLYKWNTVASLRRSSCSERWYRWKLARYDWREKNFQPRDLDNISIFFDAFRTGLLRLSRPTFFFRFCLKTWSNSAGTMLLEHLARSSLLRSHVAVNSA